MQLVTQYKKNFHQYTPNVILLGLSGSGKSSIGCALAARIGYGFLDLDQWIEQGLKKSISEIFKGQGESYYRQKEEEAVSFLSNVTNHVIALGGETTVNEANWQLLQNLGTTVWIDCSLDVIAKRFLKSPSEMIKKPFFSDIDLNQKNTLQLAEILQRLEQLLKIRKNRYSQANIIFGESFLSAEDSATRLKNILISRNKNKQKKQSWKKDRLEKEE